MIRWDRDSLVDGDPMGVRSKVMGMFDHPGYSIFASIIARHSARCRGEAGKREICPGSPEQTMNHNRNVITADVLDQVLQLIGAIRDRCDEVTQTRQKQQKEN